MNPGGLPPQLVPMHELRLKSENLGTATTGVLSSCVGAPANSRPSCWAPTPANSRTTQAHMRICMGRVILAGKEGRRHAHVDPDRGVAAQHEFLRG
jgi:hypothetical protein